MNTWRCSTILELSKAMADAHAAKRPLMEVDLGDLDQVTSYTPDDMTVTVQCGVTLPTLQQSLAAHGQWLPLDPRYPESPTIGDMISWDLSGPRRHGYGTIREHLIGLKVVMPDGRVTQSGGIVVKNVAGYDMAKLFVGARGTLGIPVEAAFKLRPMAESTCLLQCRCGTWHEAGDRLERIVTSALTPVVLDLHGGRGEDSSTLLVGLEGSREDVAWQREEAARMGIVEETDWALETAFWQEDSEKEPEKWSVAPSRLGEALAQLGQGSWLARAGQGVIYHRQRPPETNPHLPLALMKRLKSQFDPHHVLPSLPW